MIIRIKYKKNPHQREFHEDDSSKFLHLSSGFGGGKSYALVQKLFKLSFLNRHIAGGCLAPSYKDLKKDMIPIFDAILEDNNIEPRLHKTDMYYTLPWTRGKLYLFSAENKLRGPNLGFMGINESTLITAERYREAIGRVRVKGSSNPQIVSVGTPEGIGNYVYEQFVERPLPNSRIIYGNTRDNAENLEEGYIASLEHSFDKVMLDAYLKGLWINMNGQQFYYSFNPDKNEDKTITQEPGDHVHCFLDFNVQYMTATFWHFDGWALKGFDEIVIENDANTQRMCDAMKVRGYHPDNTTVYPDPAGNAKNTKGQPDHVILRNNGYEVISRKAAPRMRQRQLNVNNLLDKERIKFNPDKMPTLRKDLQAVEQDPVTFEKRKDNKKLTHASDGLDYGCDILCPLSGKKPDSGIMRIR